MGNHGKNACSWAEIKNGLDPAWSYIVVEAGAASDDAAVFEAVAVLLAEHGAGIRSRAVCRETTSGHHLMLVQVDPARAEAVQRSLLGPRLPPSVTVYFYNHSPGAGNQLTAHEGRR
jgi:hypothetical protein